MQGCQPDFSGPLQNASLDKQRLELGFSYRTSDSSFYKTVVIVGTDLSIFAMAFTSSVWKFFARKSKSANPAALPNPDAKGIEASSIQSHVGIHGFLEPEDASFE